MNCRNCGNKINDGAVFCTRCGSRLGNDQANGAYMAGNQPFTPDYGVNVNYGAPQPVKKKSKAPVVIGVVALVAAVVAGGFWAKEHFFGEINLEKFDEENRNSISTNEFKKFASDENNFGRYSLVDYIEDGNAKRHSILEQNAVDANNSDSLDGVHLITYESSDDCASYYYEDMIEIMSEEAPETFEIMAANDSENWYVFVDNGGMFGDHSYCFYIEGNSMLYAVSDNEDYPSAWKYMLDKGYADDLKLDQSDFEFYTIDEQFIYDYNNR